MFGCRPGTFSLPEHEAAPRLLAMMLKVWPQLAGYKFKHCWSGEGGMTADKVAHMGKRGGIDFAISCNGNSVALITYLGHQSALKLLASRIGLPAEKWSSVREAFSLGGCRHGAEEAQA
uniref:Uncharacterized protein n=1 Tax=Bosea sp. NBC_00436 TaxID=2969620 RepID=A0A9E8A5S6_9HYPH